MASVGYGLKLAPPLVPEDSLFAVLTAQSPRRTPPPTPWPSIAIHGSVLILWGLLLAAPFGFGGVWGWAAGLVYIAYDTFLLAFTFVQTLPLARAAPVTPAIGPRPSVGVIVAAKNEALVLPVTLKALMDQSDPPDQILVADDGSIDTTDAVMKTLFGYDPPAVGAAQVGHPLVRWLRLSGGGKARAMNAAMGFIDTDIVITVDADTLLEPAAIAAIRAAFASDPALVATTGVLKPLCAPTLEGRVFEWFQKYEYIRNFLSRYAWMRLESLLLISGAFGGFRREAVLQVGGFDPDCLVEDYELIHRLKRYGALHELGWRTRVIGGAQARTEAPGTAAAFLRQRRRWFGGFLQTQYWYRDMVGNARYGALGLAMLPVKAVDTLQPVYGLTAFAVLIAYIVRGDWSVVVPASGFIAAKIVLDLSFHLWSVHLYRRWLGDRTSASIRLALLAAIIEPFTFQLLRHVGAVWGWVTFLTGRQTWGNQKRAGALR